MRLVRLATVWVQCDRNLGNLRPIKVRLDDHLGGEFHPRAAQIQTIVEIFRKATQAAVNIMNLGPKHMLDQS